MTKQNCNEKGDCSVVGGHDRIVNRGIVTSEGDLDQRVKAHMIVYIVLKLFFDVEVKSKLFGAWDGC